MANNSMYLRHDETGEKIRIAKYYPSTGWGWITTPDRLQEWFGMFAEEDWYRNGVSYVLEYEHGPDDFKPTNTGREPGEGEATP